MNGLYPQTLKYFRLAIFEFLPTLEELKTIHSNSKKICTELTDLIEMYVDIGTKIDTHKLNLDNPNKSYDGEPKTINLGLSEDVICNLSRLSHRLLFTWKDKKQELEKKSYLTDANREMIHKLEELIWPLESIMKADTSYILGKYANLGPLSFPGEIVTLEIKDSSVMLAELLEEIDKVYSLADRELLEREKIENLESVITTRLAEYVSQLSNEIYSLQFKKINNGIRNILKPGFHNRKTAESTFEKWRNFIVELLTSLQKDHTDSLEVLKSIKNRLEVEGLFIESRSKDEDQHLLIGRRDGTPDKAHIIIDGTTGEIRVEDNQDDPSEFIKKVESVLTLNSGKKIRTTRETLEEQP